jgi:primosomal protein N'
MYVIHVTPLIRGTQIESLSYFSSISYEIGSFLQVPIRGKNQTAIVTEVKPVSSDKTALKAASFSLRKLPNQANPPIVPLSIRSTASALARQYPASVGALLFTLLTPDIRAGSRFFSETESIVQTEDPAPQILNARSDERFVHYQSHIRSTFAHRGSVLLVVPTAADIASVATTLKHGITDRLVILSPQQSKRDRDAAYAKLADTTLAKLIITTPAYAYFERVDLLSIIIEQSASSHYVTRQRPYLDHRDALMAFAKVSGRSIILGDTVVRTEDEVKRRQEIYSTVGEEAKRIAFTAPLTVLVQKDKPSTESPFQLFSPTLISTITRALEGRGHVFLYAARRGLAPVVACIDCGYIFRCPDSNTPYSLVRTNKNGAEERWFVSSTSGSRVRASDVCEQCGSWRLRERGVGIQFAYDEWKRKVPDSDITLLDHDTAPTPVKAKKIIEDFYAKRSGVLIGTQIAIPYLQRGVAVSAIISLDAARATPTWRADESLFRLLMRLRECTEKEVVVQTRTEPDALLEYAKRGAVERFFDDEISLRQLLRYPPFNTFILLTWSGPAEPVLKAEQTIKNILASPSVQYYPSPHSTESRQQRHALIRIEPSHSDEHAILLQKVRSLPPFVKVEVNPERIV